MTVLHNILLDLEQEKQLGEVLFLQLDNTASENRNNTMLQYCALLVQTGVFRKVEIHFLMVGHTHEDVDQMFSRISYNFKRRTLPLFSVSGLKQAILSSLQVVHEVQTVVQVW